MTSQAGKSALVVMGPSGCGKTTLARGLTQHLEHAMFIEGDDYHSRENIARLSAGIPLSDEDRNSFIDRIGMALRSAGQPVVASCSALRRGNRERLREFVREILFVWIDVPPEELHRRVQRRTDHFMSASLMADQLATFEPLAPPECFVRIDGMLSPAAQIAEVLEHLRVLRKRPSRTASAGMIRD